MNYRVEYEILFCFKDTNKPKIKMVEDRTFNFLLLK